MRRIIFVTGTDTGVGKTLLTALLLQHLRNTGVRALAMKPFCSGCRDDVKLLQSLQEAALSTRLINPFYFPEPIAPMIAARVRRRKIRLPDALDAIRRVAAKCDVLLVEGSGGLLVPLGQRFDVKDLIAALHCATIVVSGNRLGTINHTRLTLEALRGCDIAGIQVALMDQKSPDASAKTNAAVLGDLLPDIPVISVPYLGANATRAGAVKASAKKIKKILARFASFASFRPFFGTRVGGACFDNSTERRKHR